VSGNEWYLKRNLTSLFSTTKKFTCKNDSFSPVEIKRCRGKGFELINTGKKSWSYHASIGVDIAQSLLYEGIIA